jgi:hypothetical protein
MQKILEKKELQILNLYQKMLNGERGMNVGATTNIMNNPSSITGK